MKTIKLSNSARNICMAFVAGMMIFSLGSCSNKILFLNSTVIPAARGNVKITKDNNHNYVIKIELLYLAETNRLTPPRNTYVVWMVSNNDAPKNIGQIQSQSHLKASIETVSASKPHRIFITAEDDASVQYPSNFEVLTTDNL